MTKKAKKLTEEEILKKNKQDAWNEIRQYGFYDFSEKEWIKKIGELYETMTTRLEPPLVEIGYDFWEQYEKSEEIDNINRFKANAEHILANLPTHPDPDVWFNRERGIVPNLKREWKANLEPFKQERILQKQLQQKMEDFVNKPENKDKEMSFNMDEEMKGALENIEKTCYLPTRETIEKIEEEITKRIQLKP